MESMKLNFNYEPENPNDESFLPKCKRCFNEDTERCRDCVLNEYNPKTIFRMMTFLTPYEILINKDITQKDIELVSDEFKLYFANQVLEEFKEIICSIESNMKILTNDSESVFKSMLIECEIIPKQ